MIRPHPVIWFALVAALATAQDRGMEVPPTWPENGHVSQELSGRYVFLTADKHTIVVLIPEDAQTGLRGPKKVIRIPLWNDSEPSPRVSITSTSSGTLSYNYSIGNGRNAHDEIGAWALVIPAASDPAMRRTFPTSAGKPLWVGGPSFAVIAKQMIFPDAALGRYFIWFHQDENLIRPGGTLGGFVIESSYRPGLTTAWFSAGKLLDIDQSLPREVFQQLNFIEDRQWREKYVVTVGPMFPQDTPRQAIVQSYQTGMDHMVKTGALNPSSPFTTEVLGLLRQLGQPQPESDKRRVLRTSPVTDAERAVATALRFALDLDVGTQE
jgi:hypothetical protein